MKVHERQAHTAVLSYLPPSPAPIRMPSQKAWHWIEEKEPEPLDRAVSAHRSRAMLGGTYDSDVIRINSQSGKGGVNYILKQSHGISLPDKMREEMSYTAKRVSDQAHQELTPSGSIRSSATTISMWTRSSTSPSATSFRRMAFRPRQRWRAEAAPRSSTDRAMAVWMREQRHPQLSGCGLRAGGLRAALPDQGFFLQGCFLCVHHQGRTDLLGVGIDEDIIKSSYQALEVAVNKILD